MKKTLFSTSTFFPLLYHSFRWHMRFYLNRKGFPLVCGVFLTNRCNLRCRMCSIWTDPNKQTLSFKQLQNLVEAFRPGLCYLSFSGGEPLMVDRVLDMIAFAGQRIPYIHLVSNGILVDNAAVREMSKAGLSGISFSLDGDRQWHNWIRNSAKSFDAAVGAIEAVKRNAPRMDIVVNSVLFPEALEQVEWALRLTRHLGVKHKLQPVNKHFQIAGMGHRPDHINFGAADRLKVQEFIRRLTRESHLINSPTFLRMIPDYFDNSLKCPMIRPRCLVPHFFVEANAYGRLSPCMFATGWQGTLDIGNDLGKKVNSEEFSRQKMRLEACRECDRTMYICYWEPMINFPLGNYLKYGLLKNSI